MRRSTSLAVCCAPMRMTFEGSSSLGDVHAAAPGRVLQFLRATPANRQRLLVELLAFGVYKDIGQRARIRAEDLRRD
jgi:hypothetical protein